jgi:NTP pyrophosphatase (non-canonical NTP hydrolase)
MAMTLDKLELEVIQWAQQRGLLKIENVQAQMCKVTEEVGETAAAVLRGNAFGIKDGIGDIAVTIIILAAQHGMTLNECLQAAYDEIRTRKGKTVDGTFLKEEN